MSDDQLLDDAALDRLLGRWQAPPPSDGLVARIVAEAVRADRPRLPAPVRGRARWTRRGLWTGVVAFNLVLASAVAAAFGGGALDLGRLRVAADRVIAHVLPRHAGHRSARHALVTSHPGMARPMTRAAPMARPAVFPQAGMSRTAPLRAFRPMALANGTRHPALHRGRSAPGTHRHDGHWRQSRGIAADHAGRRQQHRREGRGGFRPDRPSGARALDRHGGGAGFRQRDRHHLDGFGAGRGDGWRRDGQGPNELHDGGGWQAGGWRRRALGGGGWRRDGWRGDGAGRGAWRGGGWRGGGGGRR